MAICPAASSVSRPARICPAHGNLGFAWSSKTGVTSELRRLTDAEGDGWLFPSGVRTGRAAAGAAFNAALAVALLNGQDALRSAWWVSAVAAIRCSTCRQGRSERSCVLVVSRSLGSGFESQPVRRPTSPPVAHTALVLPPDRALLFFPKSASLVHGSGGGTLLDLRRGDHGGIDCDDHFFCHRHHSMA